MKWWVVGQRAGTFDFREGEVVRFAQAHGLKVRGHCLVWDHTNPDGLVHGAFSPSQMSGSLPQHYNRDETLRGPSLRWGCGSTRLCDRNLQT